MECALQGRQLPKVAQLPTCKRMYLVVAKKEKESPMFSLFVGFNETNVFQREPNVFTLCWFSIKLMFSLFVGLQ